MQQDVFLGAEMLPMSLWEYGESNGRVSLMEMFDNPQEEIFATSGLKMEEIIFAACRGGWPATLNLGDDKSKSLVAKELSLPMTKHIAYVQESLPKILL